MTGAVALLISDTLTMTKRTEATSPAPLPPCITLGALCRELGLARASVLHYEALGLLKPKQRSLSGYRLYGAAERQRAQLIRELRAAGLSLAEISQLLARHESGDGHASISSMVILEQRLLSLSAELSRLRRQQVALARLLATAASNQTERLHTKASWVALLRQSGFDDAAMRDWHNEFERTAPKAHEAFLQSLGLGATAIREIRRWSQAEVT